MEKKELTLQELEAQYKKLGEQIEKKKKEEEEYKKAELARVKEIRAKEVKVAREDAKKACEHADYLLHEYIRDYGSYEDDDISAVFGVADAYSKIFEFFQ